jgi:hypothetical protein
VPKHLCAIVAIALVAVVQPPVATQAATPHLPFGPSLDPAIPDPTDVRVVELDSTLHVTWTPADFPDTAWQLLTVWDGDTLQQSKVAAESATVIQANGVQPGATYTVKVHTMAADGRLSPGAAVSATADPQPPMPNAAFFDNFNNSLGLLDGDVYDVRTTVSAFEAGNDREPDRLELRQVFSMENHFHTQLIGAAGKVGITIRPRVPFDFAGRTGTFQFEMDFPPTQRIHGKWMEIVLTDTILTSEEELGDAESGELPNSITFAFRNAETDGDDLATYDSNTPVIIVNIDGTKTTFPGREAIFSPTNVRLPVVIEVSETMARMLVNGEIVAEASDFGSLPFSTGYWNVVHRSYYSGRGHDANAPAGTHLPVMGLQIIHWDTLQFDGPPGSFPPVTGAYIQPGCAAMVNLGVAEIEDAPQCVPVTSTTIEISDDVSRATSARLLMNLPTEAPTTATINGHSIDIPITPTRMSFLGVATLSTVEVPPGWLRTGANTIVFSGDRGYSQVELEVVYEQRRAQPPATHPAGPMVGITTQNFYVEQLPSDPAVRTLTTHVYSLGAPVPIDYTTKVSSSTPWLTVSSGARGRLTSPALGGTLVPLTITIDTAHPELDDRRSLDVDGRWAWIEVSGGHAPVYIAVLVRFTETRTEFATTFPYITTFDKFAIPGYVAPAQ